MKDRFRAKINAIMADPGTTRRLSIAGLMLGASRVYERLVRARADWYEQGRLKIYRLPCTVISIGNITFGGTGKTPMTLYVAKRLRRLGYKTVILSRGYKGAAEKTGGVVSDGNRLLMTPETAGDEPFMMARFLEDVPVLVGRDRVASGRLAVTEFSPDIILMDDGFQHRRLHRDLDIVLLDSARPLGNAHLIPRGSLREPPDALNRADALVFTRCHGSYSSPESLLSKTLLRKPMFRSRHVPFVCKLVVPAVPSNTSSLELALDHTPDGLKGERIFAFSAIADNNDFHQMLVNLGCRITGTADFCDHHAYTPRDLEQIAENAVQAGARFLVTTQKDFFKLSRNAAWPLPLWILGVLPSFPEETGGFDDFLKSAIEKAVEKEKTPLRILAYLDGRPGHEKQTRGILKALSRLTPIEVDYRSIGPVSASASLRQWLAYLRPKVLSPNKKTVTGHVDLIIGAGARTHIPMLLAKRRTGSPVVTCMSPAALLRSKIDLCFIPEHDLPEPAGNVLPTNGPPNLSEAGSGHVQNRQLILVGGRDEKSHFWETETVIARIQKLIQDAPEKFWAISSSPRTPEETIKRLSALADKNPNLSFYRSRETPPGWIESAYAEHAVVWVTADSISMIYEALSAGCRVGILPVRWKHPGNKFQRSIDNLVRHGLVSVFTPERVAVPPLHPHPLDEASRCAREILKRWWPRRLAVSLAETP